jgi:hypothetical protein
VVGLRRRIHGGGDWGRRRRGGGLNWTGGTGCCFMEASLGGKESGGAPRQSAASRMGRQICFCGDYFGVGSPYPKL